MRHLSHYCGNCIYTSRIANIRAGKGRCHSCYRGGDLGVRYSKILAEKYGEGFTYLGYQKKYVTIKCPVGHEFRRWSTNVKKYDFCPVCKKIEINNDRDRKQSKNQKVQDKVLKKLRQKLGDRYSVIKRLGVGEKSVYLLYHICYPGHRHFFKINYTTLQFRVRNNYSLCPNCYDKNKILDIINSVKTQLSDSNLVCLGFKILENRTRKFYLGHYDNQGSLLHYTGRDLYRWRKVSFNCPICTCTTNQANSLEKRAQHYADRIQKIYKGRYYVYQETYIARKEHVRVLDTKCGKAWNPSAGALLKHGTSCPYCQASNGEQRIMDVLDELGIPYVFQAKMGCIDKAEMPYDVYVPSYNLLIEYQGEQHYKVLNKERFGGLRTFARRKRHDYMKLKFAQNNNYQIRQIPYKVRTYNQIKTYLEDTFKELDKIKIYKEWLGKSAPAPV